ncbi:MAG: DUF1311 domain-containing protein [Saprospiraceae bacterium]|nr:DUF1311 domain-containing protein [Saprospiraceae bacterium]
MKNYNILSLSLSLITGICYGQGDLDYLKENLYLTEYYKNPFDCDGLPDDGIYSLDDRICANLKLQEADSTLSFYYNEIKIALLSIHNAQLIQSFETLQQSWRTYRDLHCDTLYGGYETHTGAVLYMTEMRRLTEVRIEEMKSLLDIYTNE